ncbi:MAG: SBBP repeat-containing protein, partial [Deltaproteobacteria bacterium]|nr:SBBP repeat-containing protein [Deltaproteobacteria bacterium]
MRKTISEPTLLSREKRPSSRAIVLSISAALFLIGVMEILPATHIRPLFVFYSGSIAHATTIEGATCALSSAIVESSVKKRFGVHSMERVPLHFEANRGQLDSNVRFIARGPGYRFFFTDREIVFVFFESDKTTRNFPSRLQSEHAKRSGKVRAVRMKFIDANPAPEVTGTDITEGKTNYFVGRDPEKWRTGIPTFRKIRYKDVYPGIDLVFYGNQRRLEYDVVIAPGGDPDRIKIALEGAEKVEIDPDGNLVIQSSGRTITQTAPLTYQLKDNLREQISARYILQKNERLKAEAKAAKYEVGFQVGSYDKTHDLIIDPVLSFSTYFGGTAEDIPTAIAVHLSGNVYIAGFTDSFDFPVTEGAYDLFCGPDGLCSYPVVGTYDVFVSKLDPTASQLLYSTYLGGSSIDGTGGIAVDALGNAYITGTTQSADFPTTSGAFQTTKGASIDDAFVAKLNPTGSSLIYSTYLGGSFTVSGDGRDQASGIAVDSAGNAYVIGTTTSADFPTTDGAFQTSYSLGGDAFVTKLNTTGTAVIYSTFLGGSGIDEGRGIALDSQGNAYLTGSTQSGDFPTTPGVSQPGCPSNLSLCYDAFVTKLNSTGSALVYSTFLGGATNFDIGSSIAVDSAGNSCVTGQTKASDFPTVNPTQGPGDGVGTTEDGFVSKLNADGSTLIYSTYLGGGLVDAGVGIATDSTGSCYVTGFTNSPDFPTANPWQISPGGNNDAFVAKLSPSGSLLFSTFLGGDGNDEGRAIAADSAGSMHVTGFATSNDFPLISPFQASHAGGLPHFDGFVAKFAESPFLADLVTTMSAFPDCPALDQPLTYSITVRNNGPDNAVGVTLDNILPSVDSASFADFVSATPSQGQCIESAGRVICELGDLESSATASISIVIILRATVTPFTNVARASSKSADDPDRVNNVAIHNPGQQTFTLSVQKAGNGSGTVISAPPGIECGSLCSASFASCGGVTLMAKPAVGSTFQGWSGGGCSGAENCTLYTINADTIVTATFNLIPTDPIISATPSSHDFGSVAVGTTADGEFTVQNIGVGTLSGTATGSAPFSIVSGSSYSLGPGESQIVKVRFSPASAAAFNKSIVFTGSGGATISVSGVGFVASVLKFSKATYSVGESRASAKITVKRTGGTTGTVEVSYETGDGTATAGEDYTPQAGILIFGPRVTSRTFTIPILNDSLDEPGETVNLILKNPTGGAILGSPGTAVLAITDNDVAGKVQFSSASYKVDEAGGSVVITVKRTGGSASGVSIDYETGGGTATAGE